MKSRSRGEGPAERKRYRRLLQSSGLPITYAAGVVLGALKLSLNSLDPYEPAGRPAPGQGMYRGGCRDGRQSHLAGERAPMPARRAAPKACSSSLNRLQELCAYAAERKAFWWSSSRLTAASTARRWSDIAMRWPTSSPACRAKTPQLRRDVRPGAHAVAGRDAHAGADRPQGLPGAHSCRQLHSAEIHLIPIMAIAIPHRRPRRRAWRAAACRGSCVPCIAVWLSQDRPIRAPFPWSPWKSSPWRARTPTWCWPTTSAPGANAWAMV